MAGEASGPEEEIVEGEIVTDEITPTAASPRGSSPADVILSPCHHGCTCGLHMQVVYGERVPVHKPRSPRPR